MTVHELKTIPPYFEDLVTGRMLFEVRHTIDRTFAEDDLLRLREWDPSRRLFDDGVDGKYTGREARAKVTYVLQNCPCLPEHLAVLGLELQLPSVGHILRLEVDKSDVALTVECHEPANADCRTVTGGCLVAEQAEAVPFDEYHDGPREPLSDGMRIATDWSAAEECYTWRGYVPDQDGGR